MIHPNELRVGNWVYTKAKRGYQLPNKLYVKVVGITNRGNIDITVDGYDYLDDIVAPNIVTPIKLAEDIILSCGFTPVEFYNNVYELEVFRLYLNKKTKSGLLKLEYENNHLELEVSSVHQLQNIYFILTGHELEISFQNP